MRAWKRDGGFLPLSERTRPLLAKAGVPEHYLVGIERGLYIWTLAREPLVGSSHDLGVAEQAVRDKADRAEFVLDVYASAPAEEPLGSRGGCSVLVEHELGIEMVNAVQYETALAKRAGDESRLFVTGAPHEWLAVKSERWDELAFEYRTAVEVLMSAHTAGSPVPTLALLALCRHHLELALKAVITAADGAPPKKIDHSLSALWNEAEPYLTISAWWDEATTTSCAATILDFDALDRDGTRFRYPSPKGAAIPFQRPGRLFAFDLSTFAKEFFATSDHLWNGLLWIELLAGRPSAR